MGLVCIHVYIYEIMSRLRINLFERRKKKVLLVWSLDQLFVHMKLCVFFLCQFIFIYFVILWTIEIELQIFWVEAFAVLVCIYYLKDEF